MDRTQYAIVLGVAVVAGLTGGVMGGVMATRYIPAKVFRAHTIQAKKFEVVGQGKRLAVFSSEGLNFAEGNGAVSASSLFLTAPGGYSSLSASPVGLFLGEHGKRRIELFLELQGEPRLRLYDGAEKVTWAVPEERQLTDRERNTEESATAAASPTIPPNPFTNPDPQARLPHPACPTCYTYAGSYQVYEDVPGVAPPLGILSRDIPNPAPGYPQGVQVRKDGEKLWYIGTEMRLGPTDEEPVSPSLPIPLIAVKRIQVRHEREIMSIAGVHSFGIGARGFIVGLLPAHRENQSQLPRDLDGVPVEIEVSEMAVAN
ncbi:MAG TPA: hypothetical protein VGX03_28950 [Candidatus Binatia bacterium]|jgi:hypothetical protein|nr:hypothetical protein [Candidatus Binatia bacterium]